MKKVGLQITRTYLGFQRLLTLNEEEWQRKVTDIRDVLKYYQELGENDFALVLSFTEEGSLITIIRPISGRGGDNVAAWLFIPNNIVITGNEVVKLINDVKSELSKDIRSDEKLEEIFSKEYSEIESVAFKPSSPEGPYAKRHSTYYQLSTILGEYRYQPYYANYRAILLEFENSMEVISDPSVTDLSQKDLDEWEGYIPPMKCDLKGGVTVRFDDAARTPFNAPVLRKMNDKIHLVFERPGFLPIRHMDQICEKRKICSLPPRMDWKMRIGRDRFQILAKHDQSDLTARATIYVNDKNIDGATPVDLTEAEAAKAHVKIVVPNYKEAEVEINFLAHPKYNVALNRAERVQEWEIELANDEIARMTLSSKYLTGKHSKSPLKGYSIESPGRLVYTNFNVLKERTIGFGIACALFLLSCLLVGIYQWWDTHDFNWVWGFPPIKTEEIVPPKPTPSTAPNATVAESSSETEAAEIVKPNEFSDEKAIEYLDKNSKWVKTNMEKYPLLQGLFDDLNKMDTWSLSTFWGDKLSQSAQFAKVKQAAEKNYRKGWNPKQGKHSGNYNKNDDETINIQGYINWLDSDQTPQSQTTPAGVGVTKGGPEGSETPSVACELKDMD